MAAGGIDADGYGGAGVDFVVFGTGGAVELGDFAGEAGYEDLCALLPGVCVP